MSSVNRQIRSLFNYGLLLRQYRNCLIGANGVSRLKSIGNVRTYFPFGKSLSCLRTRSFSRCYDHVGEALDRRTVSELLKRWTDIFQNKNIPDADSSAKIILAHLLGSADVGILNGKKNQKLSDALVEQLDNMGKLRLSRMPVQYIIGEWDFLDLTLKMKPPVFIPRPETESLALLASECAKRSHTCLEIGCGTGAISLSLLKRHQQLKCTAIDANPAAVSLANDNCQLLGLDQRFKVFHSVLTKTFNPEWDHSFDIIISNPPYIPSDEIRGLEPEVKDFEDVLALDGGNDGTNLIRIILEKSPKWLRPGGHIFLEIDPRQVPIIRTLWKGKMEVHPDCFGVERLVILEQSFQSEVFISSQ